MVNRILECYAAWEQRVSMPYDREDIVENGIVYSIEYGLGKIVEIDWTKRNVFPNSPNGYVQLAEFKVKFDSSPSKIYYYRYKDNATLDSELLILPLDVDVQLLSLK